MFWIRAWRANDPPLSDIRTGPIAAASCYNARREPPDMDVRSGRIEYAFIDRRTTRVRRGLEMRRARRRPDPLQCNQRVFATNAYCLRRVLPAAQIRHVDTAHTHGYNIITRRCRVWRTGAT